MKCPHCDRPGLKRFKGYCSKAAYKLSKRPTKLKLFCEGCGILQIRNPSELAPSGIVYCKRCKRPKGEQHSRYKGYQTITGTGYRSILVDGRYLLEHRVNWEKANNSCLIPWASAAIHHIDFISSDKLNNEPENLILLSHTEHGYFHRCYDNGHFDLCSALLRKRAKEQIFYPRNVDYFIQEFCIAGN